MQAHRFFASPEVIDNGTIRLAAEESHHLAAFCDCVKGRRSRLSTVRDANGSAKLQRFTNRNAG
jgi:hypothetical protein